MWICVSTLDSGYIGTNITHLGRDGLEIHHEKDMYSSQVFLSPCLSPVEFVSSQPVNFSEWLKVDPEPSPNSGNPSLYLPVQQSTHCNTGSDARDRSMLVIGL